MNTHTKSTTLSVVMITLFATLLFSSCADKKAGAQGKEAPSVDIQTAALTGNVEAIKAHIKAGSDLNEKDPFGGSSPLITASVFNQPEVAKLLIDAGADINFQNNDGSTALHTSAFFCRPEIAEMLLAKNADKTIRNKYGVTAYESILGTFDEAKPVYDMMGKALGPMGLKLDYAYIEKTRPVIVDMLK